MSDCQHDPFKLNCTLLVESSMFNDVRVRCCACNASVEVYRSGRLGTSPKRSERMRRFTEYDHPASKEPQ